VNRPWLRRSLIAASILLYALLDHYSASATVPSLGATLAVAPMLLGLLLLLNRLEGRRWLLPLTLVVCVALLWRFWQPLQRNFALLDLLQQVGAYGALAAGFGRSLLRGRIPLCTQWATQLHGALPEPVQRYTRTVTAVWTGFFIGICVISVALYTSAPIHIWSLFANFMILPLAVLLFVAEYAVRSRVLPSMRRYTMADSARAYLASSRSGGAPGA
jgi:uncharacterized membrane protein